MYTCIHSWHNRATQLFMFLGRTQMLFTKLSARKGDVQISPVQKKMRFLIPSKRTSGLKRSKLNDLPDPSFSDVLNGHWDSRVLGILLFTNPFTAFERASRLQLSFCMKNLKVTSTAPKHDVSRSMFRKSTNSLTDHISFELSDIVLFEMGMFQIKTRIGDFLAIR